MDGGGGYTVGVWYCGSLKSICVVFDLHKVVIIMITLSYFTEMHMYHWIPC